jgi:hypothetical protein
MPNGIFREGGKYVDWNIYELAVESQSIDEAGAVRRGG